MSSEQPNSHASGVTNAGTGMSSGTAQNKSASFLRRNRLLDYASFRSNALDPLAYNIALLARECCDFSIRRSAAI